MSTKWRLTKQRIAAAKAYISEHLIHSIGGRPMVADRYETPKDVQQTMTRLFGRPEIPGDGEVAYWMVDDATAIGMSLT